MVRQDDPLWADLHQGVLTTGLLNSALGFYEPAAAKRLGIGGGFVSHSHLMHAWKHLQDPPFVPQRRPASKVVFISTGSRLQSQRYSLLVPAGLTTIKQ